MQLRKNARPLSARLYSKTRQIQNYRIPIYRTVGLDNFGECPQYDHSGYVDCRFFEIIYTGATLQSIGQGPVPHFRRFESYH